jgi:signal transduction histidine kinase/ligand-binding sensor domain-containing protein
MDCFLPSSVWVRVAATIVFLASAFASASAAAPAASASAATLDLYQRLEDMHHTAWTGKDGLTGAPDCLAQTADGYLWIGTSNGLFRFDGVAFERVQPETGALPAVSVNALFATRDGGLWVGYQRWGVTFIAADGRVTNYSVEQGLPVGSVRSFAEDHDGVVWVAATGGLARLEAGRWRSVRMDWNYPCRSAWKLIVQDDGTLWVGGASPNKLLFLPKGTRKFHDVGVTATVRAFAKVGDAILVTEGPSTVYQVRRGADGSADWRRLGELANTGMTSDRDGGLWFAGAGGVTRLRLPINQLPSARELSTREQFTRERGLSGRIAWDVLVDREHNVWVVTQSGLDRFRRRNLAWKADPAVEDGAGLVTDSNGEVWVLSSLAPSIKRASDGAVVRDAPTSLVGGFPDRDGSIWIFKDEQFLHWRDGRFLQVPPPDEVVRRGYLFNVMAAAKDRAGRLWASVNGIGQFYRSDAGWTFVPVLPERDRLDWTATKAHADASDRVWLAYPNELAMVDRGMTRVFTTADGLDVGPLLSIASRESVVWVGGERGLAFLHDGRFHSMRTSDTPPDTDLGAIADIVATRDGLWLITAIGIAHIPDAEVRRLAGSPTHRVRYELFDLVSDLPDALRVSRRASTATADASGRVWVLTNSGLACVDPRRIVRNMTPPPVVVRAVNADDKVYPVRGGLSLPALTRTLRIDYTALSLTVPERVKFRYRLEGWETDWHDAGTRRTVFYSDLKPGRYAFRVLASNNDGVWNETGATLAFTVAPAWYQTLWFQALVAAMLTAAVAALYRLRVRRVSAALSARFAERLAERTRLARELHDTLLQTVQGSKMVADDALEHVGGDAERLRRAMERLSEWLGRAVNEGRAALNSLRASTVESNDLAEAFRRAADDPSKPPTMTVSIAVRGESRDLHPIVRDEIYRIGYEAMRNAYTHSRATRLEVELAYAHDLTLRIADNGAGIDPSIAGSGKRGRFGLPGMRERAANIGGALTIERTSASSSGHASAPAGTRITLVVPGRSVFQRVR